MTENPSNSTRYFLGAKYLWAGASLELDDVQWLHGGRRIFVYGTGQALVQVVSPDRQERRYEFRLGRREVDQLWQLCLDNDLTTIKPEQRSGLPDEAQPRLSLVRGDSMVRQVYKWAGVKDPRFDAIYEALLQLEARSQGFEPTFIGQYNAYYKPGRGLSNVKVLLWKQFEALRYLQFRDVARFFVETIIVAIRYWPFLLFTVLLFLIAYFWIVIDPAQTYGFGSALLHGAFWYQNAILALFTERVYSAPLHTGWGYRIGFAIGVIAFPLILNTTLEIMVALWREWLRGGSFR